MADVIRVDDALCFKAGMEIDADGSPHAYHHGKLGLDYLANAGRPGHWYGLVCGDNGVPLIQGANDPAPGFYISPTALSDKTKRESDPRRYVDSEQVPYIAVPPELKATGVSIGDLAAVVHNQSWSPAVVADIGPHRKYGEGSIRLARKLGIPWSPKNGGVETGVTYVIFAGTTKGWPREFELSATYLFEKWGGARRLSTIWL